MTYESPTDDSEDDDTIPPEKRVELATEPDERTNGLYFDDDPVEEVVRFENAGTVKLKVDGEMQTVGIESISATIDEHDDVEIHEDTIITDAEFQGSFGFTTEDGEGPRLFEDDDCEACDEHEMETCSVEEMRGELDLEKTDDSEPWFSHEGSGEFGMYSGDTESFSITNDGSAAPATWDSGDTHPRPDRNICQCCGWDIGEIEYDQIVNIDDDGHKELERKQANYCPGCGSPVDQVLDLDEEGQ